MKKVIFILIICFVIAGDSFADVELPYTFENGKVADADEVNSNFDALAIAINNGSSSSSNLKITKKSLKETDGVVGVLCPENMVPISAGCTCNITTVGAIFSVETTEIGAICGCSPDDLDGYDVVEVSVLCVNGTLSKPTVNSNDFDIKLDKVEEMRLRALEKLKLILK